MRIINIFLALCLLITACNNKKKEKDPSPGDNGTGNDIPKGTLLMHLHNYLDDVEVDDYNIVYTTTSGGRKISLTIAQFYISGIELVKPDGSLYAVADKNILKLQESEVYQIGEVPIGNYKSIRFKVGLSAATNSQTPSNASTDVLNRPEMWFGSTAQPDGYVFLNFEGKIDTTTNANGAEIDMQPFHYRIGTNANYKQVIMPDHNYTVVTNQVQYVHLLADYTKLFNGIQLNNDNNLMMISPSENATSLGMQLTNNIPSIFVYEE